MSKSHGHWVNRKPSPTYISWQGMKQRCTNPKDTNYPRYGALGITFDPAWNSFSNFLADMGTRPEGMSLDRHKNALGYSKSNCHWATDLAQTLNRSNTVWLTHNGVTRCAREWSLLLGGRPALIHDRLKAGWPIDAALTTACAKRTPRNQ